MPSIISSHSAAASSLLGIPAGAVQTWKGYRPFPPIFPGKCFLYSDGRGRIGLNVSESWPGLLSRPRHGFESRWSFSALRAEAPRDTDTTAGVRRVTLGSCASVRVRLLTGQRPPARYVRPCACRRTTYFSATSKAVFHARRLALLFHRAIHRSCASFPQTSNSTTRPVRSGPVRGSAGRVVVRGLAVNPLPRTAIHENHGARPKAAENTVETGSKPSRTICVDGRGLAGPTGLEPGGDCH
jgi:hypothetical protein